MNNQAAQTMPVADQIREAAESNRQLAKTIRKHGTCAPSALELVAGRLENFADLVAALSQTAGVPEPNGKLVGWWNGIMPDVTERSPYGPSVRWGADAEDSAHDIPLYDGYNPIHYRQPDSLTAAPAASGGEDRRVWQCPACPSSVEYAGKVAPPCPRCDTTTELDPTAKPSPKPPAGASVSERALPSAETFSSAVWRDWMTTEQADKLGTELRAWVVAHLERALFSPRQEGEHGAVGQREDAKATFVPCDCGCGRSCCAFCGNDVGFVSAAASMQGGE